MAKTWRELKESLSYCNWFKKSHYNTCDKCENYECIRNTFYNKQNTSGDYKKSIEV